MNSKIVFFNTGWMESYQGDVSSLKGGGSFTKEKGWGYEIFNFQDFEGRVYGFVEPRGGKTIDIKRIGASHEDKKVDNILVVWTASHPDRKETCIVGWYKEATVYRNVQSPPSGSKRYFNREEIGFFVCAKSENKRLLGLDARKFIVPRNQPKFLGRSNVWYADEVPEFVQKVQKFISTETIPVNPQPPVGKPWQTDPFIRLQVEKKAVAVVTDYYEKLGYTIQSFERDNVGWDLTAKDDNVELKLEVKGLSGENILTELTPNEFDKLKADKKFYRLCIVTQALSKTPVLKIFYYCSEIDKWMSDDGVIIHFKEMTSARIYT